MKPYRLTYADTHRFTPLVLDHLAGDPFVASLNEFPPTLSGLVEAAEKRFFDPVARRELCAVLSEQYAGLEVMAATAKNLELLAGEDTLTVTTGHQLCLFTGPLYVPLKILNTIRIAEQLSKELKGRGVVPIFWMATEDHDRPEIDHARVNGVKMEWPGAIAGAVGRLPLDGIDAVVAEMDKVLGPGNHADRLRELIHRCYRPGHTLAQATRLFIHGLFGRFGLICLDADHPTLKKRFAPFMRQELLERTVQTEVAKANDRIAEQYKVQAHAREVNLFYMEPGIRARILGGENGRATIEGDSSSTTESLLATLDAKPEKFSPNVLLRPVFQEVVLPNVAYIGGGGVLAYWFQLKPVFDRMGVAMPVLILRSSAAILPHKEFQRAVDLGVSITDLFTSAEDLRRRIAQERAGFSTSLDGERDQLESFHEQLAQRAKAIDPTLERSAGSAANLAYKGLEHLEKRFIRAAKAKTRNELDRLQMVLDVLFPEGGMQERQENFMTFYARHGENFFNELLGHLHPLSGEFTVMVDEPLG